MRIENEQQAKALRDFRDTLADCSDPTFFRKLGSDLSTGLAKWIRERVVALQATRLALLKSGIEVPDSWLQIEPPPYAYETRPESISLCGPVNPAIAAAIEHIRLLLMRWDAVKPAQKVVRDPLVEARDKWIYEECCRGIAHKEIRLELKKRGEWGPIGTDNGVKSVAIRYAKRNGLTPPPPRTAKRKQKGK